MEVTNHRREVEMDVLPKVSCLLKAQLFTFLGNMGCMSVKDELPQGLEF